ncbi:MAG: TonB-dependent copper receptor [Pseudomonadales bacterium]|nr:TonB-dependent copper receptor [Pseudomonadales bacterium]
MWKPVWMSFSLLIPAFSASVALAQQITEATDEAPMEELVVTGVRTETALHIITDAKKPRQPLPAQDGADYLKTIPGFSVIRKGGADGDPVFRGMAGSRLSMVADGETILGGCNNRMDPPTAYIFPETFDHIEVIKGPQSVLHGPGSSAGTVLFARDRKRPTESGWKASGSALAGSWGRRDLMLDASVYSPFWQLGLTGTQASQNNYEDGEGNEVHSEHERWSGRLTLAVTPTADTLFEICTTRSDGEAAYADRGVDGSLFDRENLSFRYAHETPLPGVASLDLNYANNSVDHVMDNFTLRTPPMNPVAMNPDRETSNARLTVELLPIGDMTWTLGADYQTDTHRSRMTMNQTLMPYQDKPRIDDAEYTQWGLFAELDWQANPGQRVVAGLRSDDWQVRDLRQVVALNMMMQAANPTSGETRNERLNSGFIRYEQGGFYAGVGRAQRIPDYWEMIARETPDSISAFNIDAETTTQLDVGYLFRTGPFSGSISAWYSDIQDYLLIESGVSKPMMATTRLASVVRNIDARTWGLEADGRYQISSNWRMEMTLASVRGANDTDDATLPQLAPLEARLGLHFDNRQWTASLLWRGIDSQHRIDPGKGNIVGQDFSETSAASVLSVNGGWRISQRATLTAGIDNLLDKQYSEHISRAGAVIPGYDVTGKLAEPGRTLWVKLQFYDL